MRDKLLPSETVRVILLSAETPRREVIFRGYLSWKEARNRGQSRVCGWGGGGGGAKYDGQSRQEAKNSILDYILIPTANYRRRYCKNSH